MRAPTRDDCGNCCSDDRNEFYHDVYNEMRRIAHGMTRRGSHAIWQTTALVNEALLRIEQKSYLEKLSDERVFFAIATKAMRNLLIDHYRRMERDSRVLPTRQLLIDHAIAQMEDEASASLEELYKELERLHDESPRQHAVVELRFFGGLTVEQVANVLGVSKGTAERDWRLARAKMFSRLKRVL